MKISQDLIKGGQKAVNACSTSLQFLGDELPKEGTHQETRTCLALHRKPWSFTNRDLVFNEMRVLC